MTKKTTDAAPHRPAFKLAGSAEIRHINVRKEGPEGDKVLAADIKLLFEQQDAAILAYFDDALPGFFWMDDETRAVRKLNMEPVRYTDQVTGTANIDSARFSDVTIKRFELSPRDGGTVDVTCSVTVFPSQLEIGELAKRVQDYARVTLEAHPDLFDEPAGGAA